MPIIYYDSLKVPELKKLLKEKGLPITGKKADLVERLKSYDYNEKIKNGLVLLFCKTLMGSYYDIWIDKMDTIYSLKQKISEKSGINIDKLRLEIENYATKKRVILDDNLTIIDYNLFSESTVFIHQKLC